ncbi:DinB family protein [Pontibacter saemangeumensis]|uniref:DinB family protein n=1 Tax=Pontibacter saemangeumensis TaxID=1084525 RepID=A0ABP8M8U8_9BACT
MPTTINRPTAEEYPAIYQDYMSLLPEGDILYLLEKQAVDLRYMFRNISDERAEETYAEGKWTMKEVLQHLIDAERIFGYRALCISRYEEVELPGWDENKYVYNSLANIRPLENILDEYELTRRSNMAMFRSFTYEMMNNFGVANGRRISVRGVIHVMAAHELHHMLILQDRYLKRK